MSHSSSIRPSHAKNASLSSTFAACLLASSFAHANDAFKAQTVQRAPIGALPAATQGQPGQQGQLNPQPLPPLGAQKLPMQPTQPVRPVQPMNSPMNSMKPSAPSQQSAIPPMASKMMPPPLAESAKLAAPMSQSLKEAGPARISGLGDDSRGIVAGESLTIRGHGFGEASGRVEIAVQLSAAESKALSFQVMRWSDKEIQGRVGTSFGFGDGKAAITLYPSGKSVADAISSGQGPGATTRTPWRYRFTATRVEQTISAASVNPQVLTSNYASPAPQLLTQGNKLLNGWAVSRSQHWGHPVAGPCNYPAAPSDKFKLKLASGFELIEVKVRDLNASKRYGLTAIGKCDVRTTIPANPAVQSARDGSFVIQSTWDAIQRLGEKNTEKAGEKCDGSRYVGVTKSPLGFDWDDFGTDRCGVNAEYAVDAFVLRGPAGLNPFFGTPDSGGIIK
jgi:hypothetical protein